MIARTIRTAAATALPLAILMADGAIAKNSQPSEPAVVPETLPARDAPYPGVMRLDVDASDVRR
ncbi:MAG: hypothetical protein AAGD40_07595, partial [Pseudomonadota bacterium]